MRQASTAPSTGNTVLALGRRETLRFPWGACTQTLTSQPRQKMGSGEPCLSQIILLAL